jgi:threonine dehydrogenase-like Zn-dependent dehydrogenase
LFCWLLALRGAGAILGIDPCLWRCEIAEKMGATKTFASPSLELIHAIRQCHSGWEAPDVCIEAVGHQTETLNDCIELVRPHGSILSFGSPSHPVYPIDYRSFFLKNLHLFAAVLPNWNHYLPAARDLFLHYRSELESLITHRFPIQDATRAFRLYETHPNGVAKVLLDASSWQVAVPL